MRFLTALRFLTAIPLPGRHQAHPEEMGRSIAYFPVVGLVIGLILAGLNWLLSLLLPLMVANALLIAFLVLLTGGLHLDGLVDTCDGMGGHKTVEERWQVMHDSRAGAFGIIGVVLLLLVKFVALNSLSGGSLPSLLMTTTLVFMPVVSRWAMVYAIFVYPYARPSGLGKAFKDGVRWPGFTVATIITVVIALALPPFVQLIFLALMFLVWLVTVAMAACLKRRLAGLTGDTYGAINEVVEVSVLVVICLLVRVGLV